MRAVLALAAVLVLTSARTPDAAPRHEPESRFTPASQQAQPGTADSDPASVPVAPRPQRIEVGLLIATSERCVPAGCVEAAIRVDGRLSRRIWSRLRTDPDDH